MKINKFIAFYSGQQLSPLSTDGQLILLYARENHEYKWMGIGPGTGRFTNGLLILFNFSISIKVKISEI
jgi:hypothetical protein